MLREAWQTELVHSLQRASLHACSCSGSILLWGTAHADHSLLEAFWASVMGVGLNWDFYPEKSSYVRVRIVCLAISVGGMLITALLLGIVSGRCGVVAGAYLHTGLLSAASW